MRPNSIPVVVVRNATSLGYSAGSPGASRTRRAIPSRRNASIVRAATWLHFTLGGAPAARASATITAIPRQARSIASDSPTGPAPTISTGAASRRIARYAARRSLMPPDPPPGHSTFTTACRPARTAADARASAAGSSDGCSTRSP